MAIKTRSTEHKPSELLQNLQVVNILEILFYKLWLLESLCTLVAVEYDVSPPFFNCIWRFDHHFVYKTPGLKSCSSRVFFWSIRGYLVYGKVSLRTQRYKTPQRLIFLLDYLNDLILEEVWGEIMVSLFYPYEEPGLSRIDIKSTCTRWLNMSARLLIVSINRLSAAKI